MTLGKNYKWNFQDMLKTISLSLLLRSLLRVLREVWDYNEEKQEKQKTKCTVCLRNGSKEGKGQGNIHQSFQVGKGFALIEIFVKELSKTAITGVS